MEECAAELVDLLRYNGRLNCLGVHLHGTHFNDYIPALLPVITEGLRFNRSIVHLELSREIPLIDELK